MSVPVFKHVLKLNASYQWKILFFVGLPHFYQYIESAIQGESEKKYNIWKNFNEKLVLYFEEVNNGELCNLIRFHRNFSFFEIDQVIYASVKGNLELPLLKGRRRFDVETTSNLEVYIFRGW